MGGQGQVLGLLERLGLQEGPSRVADGCDGGVVGEAGGLEGDVDDDGEVDQLVEVGDGGEEDAGGGGDGDELSVPDGGEDGEQRVGVVPDRDNLRRRRGQREDRDEAA
jgi:hypothetical protein